MIICFSGTGNSLLVARQLQSHLGGDILMLEGRRLIEPDSELIRVPEDEPVVWVMPVYSWGIPPVVVPFLRRSKLKITPEHSTPHFLVLTCGDDTGYADHQWAKIIGRRGWNPRGSFSVTMPNTYVLMKGFDVDTPEVEAICSHIGAQPGFDSCYLLPDPPTDEPVETGAAADFTITDEFRRCAMYIATQDQASITMLQRKFEIGFNKAGRFMDQMQQLGIVGPANGAKPRQVLMGPDEAERILN